MTEEYTPKKIKWLTRLARALNNKRLEEAALTEWEKKIIKQRMTVENKAKENKKEAIKVLMYFKEQYEIEDSEGKPYRKQDLETMTHKQLLELLTFFLNDLEKEVGGEE